MSPSATRFDWDIFCCVVDNFGDIGVTWRLAKQLAADGHGQVRLWVDDLASFAKICPPLDPASLGQWQEGVYICPWQNELNRKATPAKVVIEAFACQLPPYFIEAMAAQIPAPQWVNLEYLSAEPWVEQCHGLASPQRVGTNALNKYFYFPGFSAKTGGLLCERALPAQCQQWQQDEKQQLAFWQGHGVSVALVKQLKISLFTYENTALISLVQAWRQQTTPITLLLPMGRALADVLKGADIAQSPQQVAAGAQFDCQSLTIKVLPMTPQDHYDRLLWSSDINFVRGEDSFVRAQWAARPFIWHIYPQQEEAHIEKLEQFLDSYLADAPPLFGQWLRAWHLAFNRGQDCDAYWCQLPQFADQWRQHALQWSQKLLNHGDLVTGLVKFLESRI